MRNVTVAAVQMKCSKSVEKNIAHAEELVRQAAAKGAEIVLLPELFERPYFCQERRYEYYEYIDFNNIFRCKTAELTTTEITCHLAVS